MAASHIFRFAQRKPTAVPLEQLFRFGRVAATDKRQRILNSQFLHNELQIRIAQRVVELSALPMGLPQTQPIKNVISWYEVYFNRLAEISLPSTEADEVAFTAVLESILQDNSAVIETTSRGVLEVKRQMKGFTVSDQLTIDKVLNRFYLARIGLRFLIEHHIVSRKPVPGFSGLIESSCKPIEYIKRASAEAGATCEYRLGSSPGVTISEHPSPKKSSKGNDDSNTVSFTYVPSHLHYILCEIFKNAFRAVTERYLDQDGSIPNVSVTVVEGESDVTLRISDKGGGIERSKLPVIWSYLHTTAQDPETQEEMICGGNQAGVLAGYGVGLPLSRLYARYFGGDLDVKSMDGLGSDVYLNLPRLGYSCESLPLGVITSPGEGDSSPSTNNSSLFFFGDRKSWAENAELGTSPPFMN